MKQTRIYVSNRILYDLYPEIVEEQEINISVCKTFCIFEQTDDKLSYVLYVVVDNDIAIPFGDNLAVEVVNKYAAVLKLELYAHVKEELSTEDYDVAKFVIYNELIEDHPNLLEAEHEDILIKLITIGTQAYSKNMAVGATAGNIGAAISDMLSWDADPELMSAQDISDYWENQKSFYG